MSVQRVQKIVSSIQNGLKLLSDEKKAIERDAYLKLAVKHRGVYIPQVCEVTKSIIQSDSFKQLDFSEKIEVAETLLKSEYGEDKHASCKVYDIIHKKLTNLNIDNLKNIIQNGYVQEWESCDGLSKSLRNWTKISPENTFYLSEWCKDSTCQWTRRCFCVSQITFARKGDAGNFKGYMDLLFNSCEKVIPYYHRYNQLGVGWLLREMYLAEPKRTINFIEKNYGLFSREGLRSALEKMPKNERNRLLEFQKIELDNKSTTLVRKEPEMSAAFDTKTRRSHYREQ